MTKTVISSAASVSLLVRLADKQAKLALIRARWHVKVSLWHKLAYKVTRKVRGSVQGT